MLSILYIAVYMSVPIYQCIPPLLPSLAIIICYLHLWLYFCIANKFISTIFLIPHLINIIQHLFFSFWLTSLCITASKFIHHTRTNSDAFALWLSNSTISDQYKEIEENNRMGKTRVLFKKIRDTKGTFNAKWAQ